jgi:hypothetical protein
MEFMPLPGWVFVEVTTAVKICPNDQLRSSIEFSILFACEVNLNQNDSVRV